MMRRFRQFPTIGGRRGGIPADCVLVQYLRSTGTQYIDTGIVATPTTGAYWKVKCNTYNDGCLGMYQSSIDMLYIDFYGNGIYFRYGKYASSKITSGFDASGVNEMECKDGSCYLNGESVYDGANTSSIGSDSRTLYIFARNHRGSAAGYALVDLYAHKIYDGSDLVADFVPVRRVENGVSVGYMCDRLTGELYGNQGTGAFVVGPDKGAWTNPYVTDGLVAMWDGEWNAGGGVHDAAATVIKDLIGSNDLIINGSGLIGDDEFSVVNRSAWEAANPSAIADLVTSGSFAIEIVGVVNTFGNSSNWFYFNDNTRVYSSDGYCVKWVRFGGSLANFQNYSPTTGDVFSMAFRIGGSSNSAFKNGSRVASISKSTQTIPSYFALLQNAPGFYIKSARVHSSITDAGLAANFAVDAERFGIS